MRSKAAIGNHPLHPAMVAVPIGAFTVMLVADVAARVADSPEWSVTARHSLTIGIVGALLAAVLGFIDYFGVTFSAAGYRWARIHMIVNLLAVALLGVSLWMRCDDVASTTAVAISTLAFLLLGASGWIGGKMVFEHKIAVVENADPEATALGMKEAGMKQAGMKEAGTRKEG